MNAVYIAGPDVFYPDAERLAQEHKALCRRYGFEPMHPIDQPTLEANHIYRTNIELLKSADAVVANLNPFRGAEVDSGTAFEVGFAIASGKPVVGYIASAECLRDRVGRLIGSLAIKDGAWRDGNGNLVENFGHSVNLMLAESCVIQIGGIEDALLKLATMLGVVHAM
jgi:nucleoside 2-deoxyribosyltransferase